MIYFTEILLSGAISFYKFTVQIIKFLRKMKKIILLTFVTIGLLQTNFAQYQRMVLFEEFTQASCPPCASQNPAFNALLQDNEDIAVAIKYQVWWPGFDPMYLMNETDVDARVGYYGVSGVPHATMDGVNVVNDCVYYEGAPACVEQSEIDAAAAITSPFEIVMTHSFTPDYKTINVHVDVTSGPAVTGSLKLHVVVTEKAIYFDTAPGSNGEEDFFGVMKIMLPGSAGTTTGDFAAAEIKSYDFSWDLENIYDLNQIQVVAFMQDDATKDVLQSGVSIPIGGLPDSDYQVNNVSSITCSTSYNPIVNVTNNSAATLIEMDVEYSIDGGSIMTYNWTGSIAPGASGNITLPTTTLAGAGTHSIEVEIVSTGVIDINMVNNNASSDINVLDVAMMSVNEGFVDVAYPPDNWAVDNLNDGTGWSRATGEGGYGESTSSTKSDFFNIPVGTFELYLPKMDLSTYIGDLNLVFDRAYAKYDNTYVDELRILASDDCGTTWNEVYAKESDDLATASNTTSLFKPQDDEWETDEVDMNDYSGMSEVLVKFQAISGFGNMLYVDNIRLATTVSIIDIHTLNQFEIYPNPASDNFNAEFNLTEGADIIINVVDATGKTVANINNGYMVSGSNLISINTADLATGIYSVIINANGKNVAYENVVVSK